MHECNPANNKYKFSRRTPEECARNEQLVIRSISLECMKRLLFEPCLDEKCDCGACISYNYTRSHANNMLTDNFRQKNATAFSKPKNETPADIHHQISQFQAPDPAQASTPEFDSPHENGVHQAGNGGPIFDGNIDSQKTACRIPDLNLASLEMFTGNLSEPTIDPGKLILSERPESLIFPWTIDEYYSGIWSRGRTRLRSHKTASISETTSSLASLSLGMPAQKK
jgi:hypothetical protein